MAIDTKNEKLSLISLLQPFSPPVPDSSDGLGQDDRQHLIWAYCGILFGAGTEVKVFSGGTVTIEGKFSGTVTNEGKFDGDVTVEKKMSGTVTMN
jgi:hypothetical protein